MKICWNNLEDLRYLNGHWLKDNNTYIYMESCLICGEPYLAAKTYYKKGKSLDNPEVSPYCSRECAGKDRVFTEERKLKIQEKAKGRKLSEETKKKLSFLKKGKKRGSENPFWKGGVYEKGICNYDTVKDKLSFCEEMRKDENSFLEVKCTYCGKWYIPTRRSVDARIAVIEGRSVGENRFYCSENCKKECPIYNQKKYPKGFKKGTSREVQPELRQMVFKRDSYICQKCGSYESLQCHHIEGLRWNPIESADIDICITVCKNCHKKIHSEKDCRYIDMVCKQK